MEIPGLAFREGPYDEDDSGNQVRTPISGQLAQEWCPWNGRDALSLTVSRLVSPISFSIIVFVVFRCIVKTALSKPLQALGLCQKGFS